MAIKEQVDRLTASREFADSFLSPVDLEVLGQYKKELSQLVNQYGELSPGDPLSLWIMRTAKDRVPGAEEALKRQFNLQMQIFDSGNDG